MAQPESLHTQRSMFKKPGKNDGYSIFMEQYALRHGFDAPSMLKGAIMWNRMTTLQKKRFLEMMMKKKTNSSNNVEVDEMACDAGGGCCMQKMRRSACPKKRKRSCIPPKPCCPTRRKPRCAPRPKCPPKRRCAPRRKVCPKPRCAPKRRGRCGKPKCQNPGPITNNGYLNFLRVYRRKHCGLKSKELVMRGARAWCRLSECKKDRYRRQACKVTQSARHKRRRVCNPCK